MKVVIEMIQTNKINPEDLKIIRNTDKFKIEEVGNGKLEKFTMKCL